MTDAESRDERQRFGSLADYRVPAMPTRDTLQIVLTRARELFRRKPQGPLVDDARLRSSTLDMLDEAAAPPACGPLISELQATLGAWAEGEPGNQRIRCIVLPPGDRNRVVASWAERHGHAVLEAPARESILGADPTGLPDLEGDGVLVDTDAGRLVHPASRRPLAGPRSAGSPDRTRSTGGRRLQQLGLAVPGARDPRRCRTARAADLPAVRRRASASLVLRDLEHQHPGTDPAAGCEFGRRHSGA